MNFVTTVLVVLVTGTTVGRFLLWIRLAEHGEIAHTLLAPKGLVASAEDDDGGVCVDVSKVPPCLPCQASVRAYFIMAVTLAIFTGVGELRDQRRLAAFQPTNSVLPMHFENGRTNGNDSVMGK